MRLKRGRPKKQQQQQQRRRRRQQPMREEEKEGEEKEEGREGRAEVMARSRESAGGRRRPLQGWRWPCWKRGRRYLGGSHDLTPRRPIWMVVEEEEEERKGLDWTLTAFHWMVQRMEETEAAGMERVEGNLLSSSRKMTRPCPPLARKCSSSGSSLLYRRQYPRFRFTLQ